MEQTYLEKNRNEIFKKYTEYELEKDIESFRSGKGKLGKLLNHYFEEEMFKCKGGRGAYSPIEVLSNNELVEKIVSFVASKPKFYVGSEIANIKSFFRNAGRIAQKVANFPSRQALQIYENYSPVGGVVYDPSCGFGSRMSAALISGRDYIGTDPNKSLCEKLNECGDFLRVKTGRNFQILSQGSEYYIEDLDNTVDLCFTSPPYFTLEKYNEEETQSSVKFPEYFSWVEGFLKPTVNNCIRYTKNGGYILFNVKNMTSGKKYPLFDDLFNYMKSREELDFVETIEMSQLSKRDYKGKHFTGVDTDFGVKEPVMVFRKNLNK